MKNYRTMTTLILSGLLIVLGCLAVTGSARSDLVCSQLAGCTGSSGCEGPGSVQGCTIICQSGGFVRCGRIGGLQP